MFDDEMNQPMEGENEGGNEGTESMPEEGGNETAA